jgi:hypothetical protein
MKVRSGQWVQPIMKGYEMICCDCGLTHIVDFRIAQGKKDKKLRVQLKMKRKKI